METIPDKDNKMMGGPANEEKQVQPIIAKAVSVLENEYFYPESNGYKAIAIRAATKSDADAIYMSKRQPISEPETEEKVEETETNNE